MSTRQVVFLVFLLILVIGTLTGLAVFVYENRPTRGRHSRNPAPPRIPQPRHAATNPVVKWLTEKS